jgi:LuxR family maltose regulon positive regulatory protein
VFDNCGNFAWVANIVTTEAVNSVHQGGLFMNANTPEEARNEEVPPEVSWHLQATIPRWQERHQRDTYAGSPLGTPSSLSTRERSILEQIGQGKSNKEIAKDLSIAPETVKSHVKNIFAKLAVKKRAHAVARAQRLGLVEAIF